MQIMMPPDYLAADVVSPSHVVHVPVTSMCMVVRPKVVGTSVVVALDEMAARKPVIVVVFG
jgi:hypothetical protein